MRGSDKRSGELFSYVDLELRIRRDHPLRAIRSLTDAALAAKGHAAHALQLPPQSEATDLCMA
jgi:hypothetical protein